MKADVGTYRTLVLVATSVDPDPYVNVICHTLTSGKASSVLLVVIEDPAGQRVVATDVQASVAKRLAQLADPQHFPGTSSHKLYSKVLADLNVGGFHCAVIPYSGLYSTVSQWAALGHLVDVTALDKRLSIEVVSILVSRQYRDVYTFRFLRAPLHSDADLYHNIGVGSDFEYGQVADTVPMQQALAKLSRWSMDVKTFAGISGIAILVTAALSFSAFGGPILAAIGNFSSLSGLLAAIFVLVRTRR